MSSSLAHLAPGETKFSGFISRQFFQPIPPIGQNISLKGKKAIVTGSNVGLGYSCAEQLLDLDLSHLILAVRTKSTGDAAAEQLKKKHPQALIEVEILDMASPKSVVAFTERLKTATIDIAVLNAGLSSPGYAVAEETGNEITMQVNFLSTALLAMLLMPLLKKSSGFAGGPGRLCLVGSDAAYWAPLASLPTEAGDDSLLTGLNDPKGFDTMPQYMVSKLLLLMFVEKLASTVSADEVVITCSNPGACKGTAFASKRSWVARVFFGFMGEIIGRTTEHGARMHVFGAVVGKECHGSFLSDATIKP